MPVYYVIAEYMQNPASWGIYKILEVVECVLDDVISGKVNMNKYRQAGNYQTTGYIFYREPNNPFREQAKP